MVDGRSALWMLGTIQVIYTLPVARLGDHVKLGRGASANLPSQPGSVPVCRGRPAQPVGLRNRLYQYRLLLMMLANHYLHELIRQHYVRTFSPSAGVCRPASRPAGPNHSGPTRVSSYQARSVSVTAVPDSRMQQGQMLRIFFKTSRKSTQFETLQH